MADKAEFQKVDIAELIIVEGKDDISALKRAVNADIMITNGLGLTKQRLEEIAAIAQGRGVIIFTDPDYPGSKIRTMLKNRIPNCKHAYLHKSEAVNPKNGKYGVEYAEPEAIVRALKNAKATAKTAQENYTLTDLVLWGLAGQGSQKRREELCRYLRIGQANAKGLLNKLNAYQIPRADIEQFLRAYDE